MKKETNLTIKLLAFVFIAIIVLFNAKTTKAQLLLEENFNYTVGTALTANGWSAHSGAGTNPISVVAPTITYTNYPSSGIGNEILFTTSGEDVNKTFTAQTSGNVYAAFLVNITTATTAGDYFFHFGQTIIGTTFKGKVFVKKDASGNIAFGISKTASVSSAAYSSYTYSLNTTYLLVVKYSIVSGATNDVTDLFINPEIGGIEPSPTVACPDPTSAELTEVGCIAIRQGSTSGGLSGKIDGIRIGTSWSDILPSASTPSILISGAVTGFGNQTVNTISTEKQYSVSGNNLTANIGITAPTGFEISTTSGSGFGSSVTLTQTGGTVSNTDIFVRFHPTAVQAYLDTILHTSTGATTKKVGLSGTGTAVIGEPSEHVTAFATSTITHNSIKLTWIGATGAQLPEHYLILAKKSTGSYAAVADGTPVADDNNWSDNNAAVNVIHVDGVNTYTFTGLSGSTTYDFEIYPYTNLGTAINFKTDGTVPTSGDTTLESPLLEEYFTNCPVTNWIEYNVASNKNWTCGSGYESINGFGGDAASNDWLITPAINLNNTIDENLKFSSWTQYSDTMTSQPIMSLKYSTDYSGSGDPLLASWTDLVATFSASNSQLWTSSGNVSLSSINGNAVHFAFIYKCSGTGSSSSSSWRIDSVLVTGTTGTVSVLVTDITVTGEANATTITTTGGTLQMNADILPANATIQTVTWSLNPANGVASINTTGLLTATNNGQVYVIASANDGSGVKDSIQITISGQPILVTSITVTGAGNATTITTAGGTLQMNAAILPLDATIQTVTWSVTNGTGSASINTSGLLTAISDGDVTVKALADDASGIFGTLVMTISGQPAPVATLPTSYSGENGGWLAGTLPLGWTKFGLGSDYTSNYDGVGGNAAKFDGSGDYLKIAFNTIPDSLTYWIKGNSYTGGSFDVEESTDGNTWTNVVSYTTLNAVTAERKANKLLTTSRYARFIYTTKNLGNVGLDGVAITPKFYNATINGNVTISNDTTFSNVDINVGGILTLNSGINMYVLGNWTNSGSSVMNGIVVFNGTGSQNINGANIFKNLTINNSSKGNINANGTIQIEEILKLTAGNFVTNDNVTLLSTSTATALVESAGGTITGNITMQRYIGAGAGYKFVSSPFANSLISNFNSNQIYTWSETGHSWSNATGATSNMVGYAARYLDANPKTISLSGIANDGNLSIAITKSNHTGVIDNDNWNLVGNPYPSPIDWNLIDKTNIEGSVYYFVSSGWASGHYGSYNGTLGTNGASKDIPSMQGFFVHAINNGNFDLTNSSRTTLLNPTFLKNEHKKLNQPILRIQAIDQNSNHDEAVVYFDNQATSNFDPNFDAYKIMNIGDNSFNIYTKVNNSNLSINVLPELVSDVVVPLAVAVTTNGDYTINASEIINFTYGTAIYLDDITTGTSQNLIDNPSYQFTASTTDANRFFLRFIPLSTGIKNLNSELFNIFVDDNKVIILNNNAKSGKLSITNSLGQEIVNDNINSSNTYSLKCAGFYNIRIISEGKVYIQKIIIK